MSKELILKGSMCDETAKELGLKLVNLNDVVVEIEVSSRIRQIGRTSIAHIIQNALNTAGYTNVDIAAGTEQERQRQEEFVLFKENKVPNLKIKIIDKNPNHCWR